MQNIKQNYKVTTRENYDKLMQQLEKAGYTWANARKPTEANYWDWYKDKTVICIDLKQKTFNFYKDAYVDTPIFKGQNIFAENTTTVKREKGICITLLSGKTITFNAMYWKIHNKTNKINLCNSESEIVATFNLDNIVGLFYTENEVEFLNV